MSSVAMNSMSFALGCPRSLPRPSRKPTSSCSPPSGDNNAIHINEEFAAGTIFKGRIAHGLLSASVISAAIANKLPGPGSIYVSQSLRFRAPVRANDTIRATVTVKEMIPVRFRVLLATVCTVGGLVVIESEAVVALPAPSPPEYLSPVAFEKEAALA